MEGACNKHRRNETRMKYCTVNTERRGREHYWEDGKKGHCKNTALVWTEIF